MGIASIVALIGVIIVKLSKVSLKLSRVGADLKALHRKPSKDDDWYEKIKEQITNTSGEVLEFLGKNIYVTIAATTLVVYYAVKIPPEQKPRKRST